ncbi:MAG: HAAS signaling domain-containing protein [Acidimicrobiales bacterium]
MSADPIEAYLDRLLGELRGGPADVRRVLAETEAHLYEAVELGGAEGLSLEAAQALALERFGKPAQVARQFRIAGRTGPPWSVIAELACRLWLMAGVGLTAVGLSGLLAWGMMAIGSRSFVFGGGSITRYTPSECARYLGLHPAAHTCAQAVLAENVSDGLEYRVLAGALAVVILASYGVLRRRRKSRATITLVADSVVAALGAGLFGAATVVLIGGGIDLIALGRSPGAGQLLSGGILALPGALAYGLKAARTLGQGGPGARVRQAAA